MKYYQYITLTFKQNKGFLFSFGATLSRAFSRFLLVFLASFLLSKYEFGIFNIFLSIYFFSRLFSENSLNLPFIKFITDGENKPSEVCFQVIILKILYTILVSAVILFFADLIIQYSGLERKGLLLLLPFMLFSLTFYMFVGQILIAKIKMRHLFSYELLNCLIFVVLLAIFHFTGRDFSTEKLIIIFSFGMCISALVGIYFFKHLINITIKTNKILLLKIFHYSKFTVLSGISSVVILKADVLMLGYLRSPQEVGIYGMAMFVNEAVNMIFDSVLRVCLPQASAFSNNNNQLKTLFQQSVKKIYMGIIPIIVIIAVVSPSVVHLIYNGEYDDSIFLIYLFLVASVIKPVGYVAGVILGATGNIKIDNRNCWIAALVNLIFNYLLIPVYGVMGAAIASIISFASLTMLDYLSFYNIVFLQKETMK
ncbi:MAG: oligosaccharide flippase family protein [Pseudomonadota bacterium]